MIIYSHPSSRDASYSRHIATEGLLSEVDSGIERRSKTLAMLQKAKKQRRWSRPVHPDSTSAAKPDELKPHKSRHNGQVKERKKVWMMAAFHCPFFASELVQSESAAYWPRVHCRMIFIMVPVRHAPRQLDQRDVFMFRLRPCLARSFVLFNSNLLGEALNLLVE